MFPNETHFQRHTYHPNDLLRRSWHWNGHALCDESNPHCQAGQPQHQPTHQLGHCVRATELWKSRNCILILRLQTWPQNGQKLISLHKFIYSYHEASHHNSGASSSISGANSRIMVWRRLAWLPLGNEYNPSLAHVHNHNQIIEVRVLVNNMGRGLHHDNAVLFMIGVRPAFFNF